ncbi:MAG TPA: ABC transporter ATP-binding protein [Steroidobacteraceae bacterium]|jgi:HlyD family secretion protein
MNIFSAVWRLLNPRQRRRLVALQLLSVLMAASTVGGIAAVLPFFTVLADSNVVDQSAVLHFLYRHMHFASERTFVVALGIGFAAVVVLANAVNLIGSLMMTRFAFQVGDTFCTALFDEYLHRSFAFHSTTHSSILSSKVLHEIGRVTAGILQSGLILVTNLVTITFIVAAIVFLNPLVAIFAIVGLSASYAAIYVTARGKLLRNGLAESRDFAARTKLVGESFGAIKEIILLRAQSFFVAKFAERCKSISKTIVSTQAISQNPRHVLECVMVCSLVGAALYLSGRGAGPWIAQLTFVGLAAYRLLPALQQVYAAIVRIRADRPAFESIASDLRQARVSGGTARCSASDRSLRGRPFHEIRLQAVSFRHSGDRPAAISNLTLGIPAGAAVGFIGANASGKTTLVDLLAGLLVPQSGHLAIDGIVVDDANRSAWQSAIAYVPQQIYVLDAMLLENIALGVPVSQIDLERIRSAARLARLDECIATLPHGYDEMLGEGGGRLSGGQRQRVGIARALYRDASVLILDEATSALDAAAEQEIIDTLVKYRRGRTILLIAHRFGSLRHCDLIVELQGGAIARSGTYDELIASSTTRAETDISCEI